MSQAVYVSAVLLVLRIKEILSVDAAFKLGACDLRTLHSGVSLRTPETIEGLSHSCLR